MQNGAICNHPEVATMEAIVNSAISVGQAGQDSPEDFRGSQVTTDLITLPELEQYLARMNLLLHGVEDFRIVRQDTLRNPAFYTGNHQWWRRRASSTEQAVLPHRSHARLALCPGFAKLQQAARILSVRAECHSVDL
jgi:hypothetical protein